MNHNIYFSCAGSTNLKGFQDGEPTVARFNSPIAVAVDSKGNVYVSGTPKLPPTQIFDIQIIIFYLSYYYKKFFFY